MALLEKAAQSKTSTIEKKASSPIAALSKYMAANTKALQSLLGDEDKVRRFQRILVTIAQNDPSLLECTPQSIVGAAMQAAILDLEIDRALGHCYLVPYWNKKKGLKEAQFQLGYKGILELARRSGEVRDIFSVIVYENEPYELQYTTEGIQFSHTPMPPSQRGEQKIAVYSIILYNNGGSHLEWVWGEEVEQRKKFNPAVAKGNLSPWSMNTITEEAMWLKVPIRKSAKYLPLTPKAKRVIELEEFSETTGTPIDYGKMVEEGSVEAVTPEIEESKTPKTNESSQRAEGDS